MGIDSKMVSSEFCRTMIAGGCVFARDMAIVGLGLDLRRNLLLEPREEMTTWFEASRFINMDVDMLPRDVDMLPRDIKTFSSWSFRDEAVVRIFLAAPPLFTLSNAVWLKAVLMRGDRLCFWNFTIKESLISDKIKQFKMDFDHNFN